MLTHFPDIKAASILVVDDTLGNLEVLEDLLSYCGFTVQVASDGAHALAQATLAKPDMILLDVVMPQMDGYEVCRQLKAQEATCDIPIIFMTALTTAEDKARGFELGAVDYVTKPFQRAELLARVSVHLRLRAFMCQLQSHNSALEQTIAVRTQELRRAYAKLEKIDHHKSDFIKIAAHELRTPLTAIEGYAQLLRSDPTTPMTTLMLDSILQGARRLGGIINLMLDIARIDAELVELAVENISLREVFEQVLEDLAPALSERHLRLSLGITQLPRLMADPRQLYKVFYHLLINAIKYTPDGRAIEVSGHPTSATNERGAGVQITVRDEGIGIDPAYHELIFEKFFQPSTAALHSSGHTKFKGGGPGLGLAIAQGIVQAHRGRIWAESPGHDEQKCPGSAFHVWLPSQSAS